MFALGERVVALQNGTIVSHGTPHDVLETPIQETFAQLAGFENFLDATVLSLHAHSGTMHCRLTDAATEIEAPLSRVVVGSVVRIAVRAGDILVATELPRGLSTRNILPGTIRRLTREGAIVKAEIDAGKMFGNFT